MEISSRLITLGEMASTITHEINQPLTAIVAYTSTAIEVMDNASEVNKKQVIEVFQKLPLRLPASTKLLKTSAPLLRDVQLALNRFFSEMFLTIRWNWENLLKRNTTVFV